jgi:hypothetical protein
MSECRECELAIYCYSEASTWIFRTMEEMAEKQAAINTCPRHNGVPKPGLAASGNNDEPAPK